MEFHPGECQSLRITNKVKKVSGIHQILGPIILEVDSSKYLGVAVDKTLSLRLKYSSMIKKICNSTSSDIF